MLMRRYSDHEHINLGCGDDVSIAQIATMVMEAVGLEGALSFDRSKPDGMPRKLTDVTKLTGMGWRPTIGLKDGLADAYRWFLTHASRD
jgi:GDP-L-fucose synthase